MWIETTTVLVLAGSALTVAAVTNLFVDWLRLGDQSVRAVAFFAIFTAVALRLRSIGVYVGDRGVRRRLPWATRTVPWEAIGSFEVRAAPPLIASRVGQGPRPDQEIWLVTKDGSAYRTLLWSRRPNELEPVRSRHAVNILSPGRFEEALEQLRARLR